MRGLIPYSGALAQVPQQGGLTWLHLQFVLGLRRLGWDVLFLDRLAPDMFVDVTSSPAVFDDSPNIRYFRRVADDFGLNGSFSLVFSRGERTIGVLPGQVLELASRADLLLNVMGYLDDAEILSRVRRRVFIDIDPGFGQMWRDLGLHDSFRSH